MIKNVEKLTILLKIIFINDVKQVRKGKWDFVIFKHPQTLMITKQDITYASNKEGIYKALFFID